MDLMCFFFSHSFLDLAVCFVTLSSMTHLQTKMKEVVIHDNTVNGHVNWLLGVVKSSSNLSKTNTSMLDCRDDVHWFILSNSE